MFTVAMHFPLSCDTDVRCFGRHNCDWEFHDMQVLLTVCAFCVC